MLDKIIQDRFNILEPGYTEFVKSNFTTILATQLGEHHKLPTEKTIILSNAIILFLVFLLDLDDFINFIVSGCGVSKDEAGQIAGAVLESMPEHFLAQYHNTEQQFVQDGLSANDQVVTEPTPETIHSTTQDAILKKDKAVTWGESV
jgi:hypothetical protein